MKDRAARLRTGVDRPTGSSTAHGGVKDHRIWVDLGHLRALEVHARGLSLLPRQPARSVLNGRHASKLRGRGLDFAELRDYLPSDDIRSIDWKVTARTGKPHVRVFTEERDRPTLLVVDQRMSMFFGSVLNMKAVTAAECAAIAAFTALDQGDRIGGIVFGDNEIAEIPPKRSRAALNRFLGVLAKASHRLQASSPAINPLPLNRVLEAVTRIARRDHLVIVLSDFDGVDGNTDRLVSSIARHNDLVLGLVTDPLAENVPAGLNLVISDGELQAQIDSNKGDVRKKLEDYSRGRIDNILGWQRRLGVPVLPFTTAEDSARQLRRLLGLFQGAPR